MKFTREAGEKKPPNQQDRWKRGAALPRCPPCRLPVSRGCVPGCARRGSGGGGSGSGSLRRPRCGRPHVTAGGAAPVPAGIGRLPAGGDGISPGGSAAAGGTRPQPPPGAGPGGAGADAAPRAPRTAPGPPAGLEVSARPRGGLGGGSLLCGPRCGFGVRSHTPSGGDAPPARAAGRCWGTHRKLPGGDLLAEDESGWFSTPSKRGSSVST